MQERLEVLGAIQTQGELVTYKDLNETYRNIQTILSRIYGFRPHHGFVATLDDEKSKDLLRNILIQRGEAEEYDKYLEALAKGESPTAAIWTHDIDFPPNDPSDYIIFLPNKNISAVEAIAALSEETMHSEHAAFHIIDNGESPDDFEKNFSTLTREAIGYLGRIGVFETLGLGEDFGENWTIGRNVKDYIGHIVGYGAMDDLKKSNFNFPHYDLFHASNQMQFWKIIGKKIKEPVDIILNLGSIPTRVDLESAGRSLVTESGARDVINLTFS